MSRIELTRLVSIAVTASLTGCVGSSNLGSCAVGQSRYCSCDAGSSTQTCGTNGTWGKCACVRGDVGAPGVSFPSDTGTPPATENRRPDLERVPELGHPDLALPSKDLALEPDQSSLCSLLDQRMYIGDAKTVTHGAKKLVVKLKDIGVSSGVPAALLEIDGSANVEIVKQGKSVTSSVGFLIHVSIVNNQGAAADLWAQVCVSFP